MLGVGFGHLFRMNPSTHPEFPSLIFCRKCGRSAGKDPRKINNQLDKSGNKLTKWCTQQKLPREQWAEQPITLYQYSKKHQDDLQERWCTKPIKGHQLEWNGKLGFVRFHEDGGLVHQTMPAHSQHRQDPRERNAPMQQNSSLMDAWTKQTTEASVEALYLKTPTSSSIGLRRCPFPAPPRELLRTAP